MSNSLLIKNRHRSIRINNRLLQGMTRSLLEEELFLSDFDLTIYLVGASAMAKLNETHLGHEGPTDVITFDYSGSPTKPHGELFICIDEAIAQAKQFRTTWQSELARYAIHGILHLRGFDDLQPAARKKMKREENRLLKNSPVRFP